MRGVRPGRDLEEWKGLAGLERKLAYLPGSRSPRQFVPGLGSRAGCRSVDGDSGAGRPRAVWEHPPCDRVGGIEPAEVGHILRRIERPVAGTGRALEATGEAVARVIAVDDVFDQECADLEVEMAAVEVVGPCQHGRNALSPLDRLTDLDRNRRVEMPIHRVEVRAVRED